MTLRQIRNKCLQLFASTTICVVFLIAAIPARAQQAAAMGVQFAFHTDSINGRFQRMSKSAVESLITQALGQVCNAQLRPWRCAAGDATPGLRFEVYKDHEEYFVKMTLAHGPARPDITDSWTAKLYSLEDLGAGVMPMNDGWVAPIRDLVQNMLKGSSDTGRSVLDTLREVVPLGTDIAIIPVDQSPTSSAVLPLTWADYKDFGTWRYRLVCHGDAGEITLHAGGVGRNSAFKPGAEIFQGLLVENDGYQLGALAIEPIETHLQELGKLVPVAFYVESFSPAPADMSVAH